MAIPRRKVLGQLTAAAVMVSLAQGCAFFNLSNPLLPAARAVVTTAEGDTMVEVKYTYSMQQKVIRIEPDETDLKISSYPNDGSPGVYFHSYSAEYFDIAGKPIPSTLLQKANFGISAYLPPGSGKTPASITVKLPVYNQQVGIYGRDLAFSYAGGVQLNPNFSHTINARVTLYGEDDNFNQVQYSLNVPIRFTAFIEQ